MFKSVKGFEFGVYLTFIQFFIYTGVSALHRRLKGEDKKERKYAWKRMIDRQALTIRVSLLVAFPFLAILAWPIQFPLLLFCFLHFVSCGQSSDPSIFPRGSLVRHDDGIVERRSTVSELSHTSCFQVLQDHPGYATGCFLLWQTVQWPRIFGCALTICWHDCVHFGRSSCNTPVELNWYLESSMLSPFNLFFLDFRWVFVSVLQASFWSIWLWWLMVWLEMYKNMWWGNFLRVWASWCTTASYWDVFFLGQFSLSLAKDIWPSHGAWITFPFILSCWPFRFSVVLENSSLLPCKDLRRSSTLCLFLFHFLSSSFSFIFTFLLSPFQLLLLCVVDFVLGLNASVPFFVSSQHLHARFSPSCCPSSCIPSLLQEFMHLVYLGSSWDYFLKLWHIIKRNALLPLVISRLFFIMCIHRVSFLSSNNSCHTCSSQRNQILFPTASSHCFLLPPLH